MRYALFKVMLLSLVRDRGALAMGFILPGVVFVIFAVIFSGAAGGDLTVKLAVADERGTALSQRFLDNLSKEAGIMVLQTHEHDRCRRTQLRQRRKCGCRPGDPQQRYRVQRYRQNQGAADFGGHRSVAGNLCVRPSGRLAAGLFRHFSRMPCSRGLQRSSTSGSCDSMQGR